MIRNKYEVFLKTAEIGNISRTAEILHYTQAGVSHAIAALEKETGFSLFVRSSSGVELTENGKRLLPSVQALINEQHRMEQTIHDINHVVAGTIRVGTFTSVSVRWLADIIKKFTALYPETEIEPAAGDYDEISQRIKAGTIDCGFMTASAAKDLYFQPLCRDQMLAVLPQNHPLAAKSAVSFEDLRDEPFILPMKGSDQDIHSVTDENIPGMKISYTLNDDFSVISLASHGLGITVMPQMVLDCFHADAAIAPFDPPQYRTLGIASRSPEQVSFLTGTFLQFLTGENILFRSERIDAIPGKV